MGSVWDGYEAGATWETVCRGRGKCVSVGIGVTGPNSNCSLFFNCSEAFHFLFKTLFHEYIDVVQTCFLWFTSV